MSTSNEVDLDPNIGNIRGLLAARGRSSTPPPPNASKTKLADTIAVGYKSKSAHHPRLKVATIVHDDLFDELEKSYLVMPLLPSCLVNSVDAGQPTMIIIHRSAFDSGPWFGGEEATGGIAADTISRLLPWSRKRSVPVLFIENGKPDRYFTQRLRNIGTDIVPSESSVSRLPEGAPRSPIFRIALKHSTAPYLTTQDGDI